MKKHKTHHTIIRTLAVIILATSILVMLGWLWDVQLLKSISPNGNPMKISTATAFILSGILLYLISIREEKDSSEKDTYIAVTTLALLVFIIPITFSIITGNEPTYDKLFYAANPASKDNPSTATPSFQTVVCFIIVSIAGILSSLNHQPLKKTYLLTGGIIGLTGLATITGYIFNIPQLYTPLTHFYPMAFHTGILFILLGTSFALLAKNET